MSTDLSTRFEFNAALLLLLILSSCGGPPPRKTTAKPVQRYPAADLNAPAKPFFWDQMRQFSAAPKSCINALKNVSAVEFMQVSDTAPSPGCGLRSAVKLNATFIPLNKPVDLSCPMSAALHVWMRDVVAPAARLHLNARILKIETFGTYACRPRNNQPGNRLSEHATANAIDISAFVMSDTNRITVRDDWQGTPERAAFLRAVRKQSCPYFSVILGPEDDRYHADHFHFDLGPWRQCR
jgi:hypothetical protein